MENIGGIIIIIIIKRGQKCKARREWFISYQSKDHIPAIPKLNRIIIIIIFFLLKKIGNARPGEGDWHPISPKTPAPHYQHIEEKKRKVK